MIYYYTHEDQDHKKHACFYYESDLLDQDQVVEEIFQVLGNRVVDIWIKDTAK